MHSTQNQNDETGISLAGAVSVSSPARRVGQPVILILSAHRRPIGAEDASDLDEGVSSLGSLAVRLVADWSLPRMRLLEPPGEDRRLQRPLAINQEG